MEKTTVNDIAKLAINGLPVEDSYKAVILNNSLHRTVCAKICT